MKDTKHTLLSDIVKKYQFELLNDWMQEQLNAKTMRKDLIKENELKQQSTHFINSLQKALQSGEQDLNTSHWAEIKKVLESISNSRAMQGFTPSETAVYVFSLKQPLFAILFKELDKQTSVLVEQLWFVSALLDELGLYTVECYTKAKENIIKRQQEDMLELSTPVVNLWEGVLALPMIGTLDSNRTQIVMETLLQRIVETGSELAIIDITGVPSVDTLVAQHLLKTVAAARLMGADCIISGIRPQIAQTIVHLGVDLSSIVTKASLADAFALALKRTGRAVVKNKELSNNEMSEIKPTVNNKLI